MCIRDRYQNELNVESEEITLEEMYLEGITLAVKNDMYEIQCESEDFNRICLQTKDMQWTEDNEYIVSFKIYSPTENSIFIQWNEGCLLYTSIGRTDARGNSKSI